MDDSAKSCQTETGGSNRSEYFREELDHPDKQSSTNARFPTVAIHRPEPVRADQTPLMTVRLDGTGARAADRTRLNTGWLEG